MKVPKNKIMFQTHVDLIFSWLSCRLDSGLLTSCKLYFLTPANLRARAWGCPFQFLGANGAASDWPFNLPLPSASLLVFGLIKQPVGEIPMKRRDSYIYIECPPKFDCLQLTTLALRHSLHSKTCHFFNTNLQMSAELSSISSLY